MRASPRHATYAEVVDRESAREILAARLEEGAARAEAEAKAEARAAEEAEVAEAARREPARKPAKDEEGLVEQVVTSPAFKDFMRTAAREIARGMFKTGRR